MAYNYFRTLYIEDTFSAGLAVGSLRAHLAANNSGGLTVKRAAGGLIEVEIATYNPLVMSYAEDMLAAYV